MDTLFDILYICLVFGVVVCVIGMYYWDGEE